MEKYDLIIVGAGPAGLCLARELANSNLKILLLDKKKNAGDVQYNTSGSFINPKDWHLPKYIFNPIHKTYFASKNEKTIKKGVAYVIDRKRLLDFLEKESRKNQNLRIEYKCNVKKVNCGKKGINYIIYSKENNDKKVSAKIYVDCSGPSAILGGKMGISDDKSIMAVGIEYLVPLKKEPYTADLFVGSNLLGGYGWIFPKNTKTAIVGYGTFSKSHFSNVEKSLREMWKIKRVSERCVLKPSEKNVAVLKTGKPLSRFVKGNLLIIGDSALQANPLVGEGVRFVMDASKIASKWIKKSIETNNLGLLENYTNEWKKKYHLKYKIAFLIQQRIKRASTDDRKLDLGVRKLKNISDKDFVKLLSGDINYLFLAKLMLKSLLTNIFQKIKNNKLSLFSYSAHSTDSRSTIGAFSFCNLCPFFGFTLFWILHFNFFLTLNTISFGSHFFLLI